MSFETDTEQTREVRIQDVYSERNHKLLYAQAGAGVIFIFGLLYAVFFASSPKVSVTIEIQAGENARQVARTLKANRVIRSEGIFLLYLWVGAKADYIQSGSHAFYGNFTVPEVADHLTNFKREEATIAVLEGSSLRGVAAALETAGIMTAAEFWEVTGTPASNLRHTGAQPTQSIGDFAAKYGFLKDKPVYATLEGYLFPDTYRLYKDADAREITDRMLANFEKRLKEAGIFDELARQKRNLYEVLTIASMLEEEARTYEDRRMIAGIIQNRIKKEMPIQIDATLMYVTGRGTYLLTEDDLNLDSPYNTYEYKGLPLGPISSPGIEAMRAALDPAKSDFIYYLSDKNGKLYYSRTFEEHKAKKLNYL